jgi:potassium-dependent mechanosensitive channel
MSLISPLKICLLCILSIILFSARAQQADSAVQGKPVDSLRNDFVSRYKKFGTEEAIRSIETYEKGRLSIHQRRVVDLIDKTSQQVKIYLKNGIDSAGVTSDLERTRHSLDIVKDGVFVNKGSVQTQRNLTVSSAILTELIARVNAQKNRLDKYATDLVGFRDRIDSLSSDTAIYSFPSDSLAIIKYLQRISPVAYTIRSVDSALNLAIVNVLDLKSKVDLMVYELNESLEDVELYRKENAAQTFNREFAKIWGPVGFSRPFMEIIKFSSAKERLVLNFYVNDNIGKLSILIFLIALITFFIRSLRKDQQPGQIPDTVLKGQLVVRYPVLSATIIVLNIFQFIFFDPPFIFSFLIWFISAVSLAIIFRKFITSFWMKFWVIMIVLFVFASADNLILQASRLERWLMLGLSIIGVVYGSYVLSNSKKKELREKKILYFIAFVVLLQTAAIFFNVFGRFNLSKALLATGYVGLVIAILFLWTARLINEALGLAAEMYKHPDRKLFYINFDRVGERVPAFFYVLLIIGWFILIGRNFYAFKEITSPLIEFITNQRTLGDYTFSISGLLIFLLILVSALILSRIVSFFAGDTVNDDDVDIKPGKTGIGSWLLLVRIFIISMGLFLALAAAGIPLDKITIILGALGVGIGLGLQGLVNNLVSGLIIAFEKPVNVGDNIEVNGKQGKVKSIGFRSSVVTLSDGACLIIPNGDLLSQHLVNWTMGKNIKKISLTVGVAYGSDLEKVKEILSSVLAEDNRILKSPAPAVVASAFNQSSIDFELVYWVTHMRESASLKSDIIYRIDAAFKKEGIVIPLPQQELHIRNINGSGSNK